jgi:bifunctional DNA-binding transcriptional regulator/antitoxin component of YhaV-PrlF toxin-antitoxin module
MEMKRFLMSLVRVKEKFQLTLPNELRQRADVAVGDYLEASVGRGGVITLTPKTFIDRRLAEGLADIRAGRVQGPYESVDEAMAAMRGKAERSPSATGRKTKRSK